MDYVLAGLNRQIKYLLWLLPLISSCALKDVDSGKDVIVAKVKPSGWNKSPARFALKSEEGSAAIHPFFDYTPNINLDSKEVNFFVTTPADNEFSYGLDVVSGHLFFEHRYCRQKDVWRNYRGLLFRPPYTQGVVPRILDQRGRPQHIYVFGAEKRYKEAKATDLFRVRVIGGVVEQYCAKAPCYANEEWASRIILIAISPKDYRYEKVKNLDDLKETLDWDYVKAFMQNVRGRKVTQSKEHPKFRVIGNIKPGFSLKFSTSYGHLFDVKELKTVKKSCFKLYDHFWEKVGKVKLKGRLSKLDKTSFTNRFVSFLDKFGDRFSTCSNFVRPASVLDNKTRHWFFSYVLAMVKLHNIGHRYNCTKKAWGPNPYEYDGKRLFDPVKELKKCTAGELNEAFPKAVDYMLSIKNKGQEYYRYIDYDNRAYGTHKQIFSWVLVNESDFKCLDTKSGNVLGQKMKRIFPEDLNWSKLFKQGKYF